MGLVGFSKKVLRRHLDPFQRRKIRVLSSLGVGLVLALLCFAQDFGDHSHRSRRLQSDDVETTTEAPDFYWDDLLLDKPYNKEPTGKKFLIVFHCIGIAFLVLGLNTVCDVYFAGSIDLLCDAWNLTPDVAGATWMAAGGSAPEFFTSIVGATIAQNDVGFGTIVGSAVFNVLFVIGLCGYVAKGNIELTWWPLFRDCTYYICSLAVLAAFTFNQLIEAWEAAILFSLYIGYVSFMFVNKPLNVWAYQKTGTPLPKELRDYVEEVNKTKAKVEPEQVGASEGSPDLEGETAAVAAESAAASEPAAAEAAAEEAAEAAVDKPDKIVIQGLDGFIKANDRWLGDEAVQTLRSMSAFDQRRVISAGTMSGCRDPVAVIQTRATKAREMEMELENLAAGKGPLLKKEKPSQAPAPSFDEEAAAMHLYAPPEEVFAWESRFAPPPIEDEYSALVGESPGVGGVVEILKAKYGCSKGQRIRVIGETHSLLQFEGGKTAPKNHEDSGWKWVIREEEEVKQSAAQAQMAALKQAAAAQLAQVEAAKAAELARAQAEAKAYAAAQQEAIRSKEHAKPKQKEPKAPRKTRRSSSSSSSNSSETEEKKHRHQKNPKKGIGREKKARSTKAKKNKKEAKSKAATRDALSKSRKTEKKKSEEKRKAKKAAKVKKRKARSSSSSSSATDVTIPGASEA